MDNKMNIGVIFLFVDVYVRMNGVIIVIVLLSFF